MRNRIRFFCVLLSFVVTVFSSHVKVNATVNAQETTSSQEDNVLKKADIKSEDKISDLLQRSELAAVLNAFIFDLEAHPDHTIDQFMNAYFGKPFKIPRLDHNGSISINNGVVFVPILNGRQVLATVTVGVEADEEIYFSVTAGYARGLTKLLSNSSNNSFDLVFTDNGYRLFGSDGSVIVDIINSELIESTESLFKAQSQENDYNLEQLFDSVGLYGATEKLDLSFQNDIDSSLASQKISNLYKERNSSSITRATIDLTSYPTFYQGSAHTCWAAVIASMVKFEFPSKYPNITIDTVTKQVGSTTGNWDNIMNAFNYYFTKPYLPTQISYLSKSDIKTVIGNVDPAYVQAKYPATGDTTSAHVVALCGYEESGSNFTIRVMNPALSSNQIMWGVTSTSTTGPYKFDSGGTIYTWEKTVRLYYQ